VTSPSAKHKRTRSTFKNRLPVDARSRFSALCLGRFRVAGHGTCGSSLLVSRLHSEAGEQCFAALDGITTQYFPPDLWEIWVMMMMMMMIMMMV